jgi:hypothetical protein
VLFRAKLPDVESPTQIKPNKGRAKQTLPVIPINFDCRNKRDLSFALSIMEYELETGADLSKSKLPSTGNIFHGCVDFLLDYLYKLLQNSFRAFNNLIHGVYVLFPNDFCHSAQAEAREKLGNKSTSVAQPAHLLFLPILFSLFASTN